MAHTYTYTISTDMPGGAVNSSVLKDEIVAASLGTALADGEVSTSGDTLRITFAAQPSQADKTTLDGGLTQTEEQPPLAGSILADHDSTPTAFFPRIRIGFELSRLTVAQVQAAKGVASDSAGRGSVETSGALTADLTVSGVGGLDAGSEAADTHYAVLVIWGSDVTANLLLSLSDTAPTLPTGYTRFRLLGWIRNDASSDIRQFRQAGDLITFEPATRNTMRILNNGSETDILAAPALVDLSTMVPPGTKKVILMVEVVTETDNEYAAIAHGDTAVAKNEQMQKLRVPKSATPYESSFQITVGINANREIRYAVKSGSTDCDIHVAGYFFE